MGDHHEDELEKVRKLFNSSQLIISANYDYNQINEPINKIHQLRRKATKCLNSRKFDEAIKCHKEAAEFLDELIAKLKPDMDKESLEIQRDFHRRQVELTEVHKMSWDTKEQQASIQAAAAVAQEVAAPRSDLDSLKSFNFYSPLLTTMNQMDTLLEQMEQRDLQGSKLPKTSQDVTEELRITNQNLRKIIFDLLYDLEKLYTENSTLRSLVSKGEPFGILPSQECDLDPHKNFPAFAPLELPEFTPRTPQSRAQPSSNLPPTAIHLPNL